MSINNGNTTPRSSRAGPGYLNDVLPSSEDLPRRKGRGGRAAWLAGWRPFFPGRSGCSLLTAHSRSNPLAAVVLYGWAFAAPTAFRFPSRFSLVRPASCESTQHTTGPCTSPQLVFAFPPPPPPQSHEESDEIQRLLVTSHKPARTNPPTRTQSAALHAPFSESVSESARKKLRGSSCRCCSSAAKAGTAAAP